MLADRLYSAMTATFDLLANELDEVEPGNPGLVRDAAAGLG